MVEVQRHADSTAPQWVCERLASLVVGELGDEVRVLAVISTNPSGAYRARCDPTDAVDEPPTGAGLTFRGRDGLTCIVIAEELVPASAENTAGFDFVVHHECQHARAQLRGEEPKRSLDRRGVDRKTGHGYLMSVAAAVIDEYRAEMSVVRRLGGPDPGGLTVERYRLAVQRLEVSLTDIDQKQFGAAFGLAATAAGYLAGQLAAAPAATPEAGDGDEWAAPMVAEIGDALAELPDATDPVDDAALDAAMDHVVAVLTGALVRVGVRATEDEHGVVFAEI